MDVARVSEGHVAFIEGMVEFIRLDVALFSQRPATQRSRPADNIQTILHTVSQIMGSIQDPIRTDQPSVRMYELARCKTRHQTPGDGSSVRDSR